MSAWNLTGLFLGAGATAELGMPLVWDLTNEIRARLTPQRLRKFAAGWRAQGEGPPNAVIDCACDLLADSSLHYEAVLGNLEVQFRRGQSRDRELGQHFHGFYQWLVEMGDHFLCFRHTHNVPYFVGGMPYYQGIAGLAKQNSPLWIFTLNHDVLVECIAAHYGIPVNSGFTGSIDFPLTNSRNEPDGRLLAEFLPGDVIENKGLPFSQPGSHGINLLKIHGALDIFVLGDERHLVKLKPQENTVESIIGALRDANEKLQYWDDEIPRGRVKATNEIAYRDDKGEMQFLRRTLLAGAFKFSDRHSQVFPKRMLDYFKSNLNYLTNLVCVGYGFGDIHINAIIREWLEFLPDRTIEMVMPGIKEVPNWILHLSPQIRVVPETATGYLSRYAERQLTPSEEGMREFRALAAKVHRKVRGYA